MKISIQTNGFDTSKELQAFVERNLTKFEKIHVPILEAQVYLKTYAGTTVQNRLCEIKLVIPGNDLFASNEGVTFEIAIHNAVDALNHQVERLRTNRKRRRAMQG